MSNVSIFESRWIDLVFEGRNKEYGAYQLRRENPRTTLKALFLGFLIIIALVSIPIVSGLIKGKTLAETLPTLYPTLKTTEVTLPPTTPPKEDVAPPVNPDENKSDIKKSQLGDPEVTKADPDLVEIAGNKELENLPSDEPSEGAGSGVTTGGTIGGTGIVPNLGSTNGAGTEPAGPVPSGVLDKMPAYPGGIDNFYKYVSRNFRTPSLDSDEMITVFVSFVIEKDGSMTDIRVPRNPGYGLDKEAIRVLKSLKIKWSPGIYQNKPVRTAYSLPIKVKMQ